MRSRDLGLSGGLVPFRQDERQLEDLRLAGEARQSAPDFRRGPTPIVQKQNHWRAETAKPAKKLCGGQ
jgi:hypothetical protein